MHLISDNAACHAEAGILEDANAASERLAASTSTHFRVGLVKQCDHVVEAMPTWVMFYMSLDRKTKNICNDYFTR